MLRYLPTTVPLHQGHTSHFPYHLPTNKPAFSNLEIPPPRAQERSVPSSSRARPYPETARVKFATTPIIKSPNVIKWNIRLNAGSSQDQPHLKRKSQRKPSEGLARAPLRDAVYPARGSLDITACVDMSRMNVVPHLLFAHTREALRDV
ncbi:unnamed protein product [Periconia digitata]|uniref:Uncharacterized protein n=1 Tax=Periconia digitata TaxID=1303443 RepID=A0A9W4XYW2_9PLEO|nr:unnamed protein product [Periconia digitata]